MESIEEWQSKVNFVKTLCGKYSNTKQSYSQPKLYAHINLYFRLLPWKVFKGTGIYSEQSYAHSPWSPYRQAVQRVSIQNNIYRLENYKLSNPERIAGGGFNSDLLKEIKVENLNLREGCTMDFKEIKPGLYKGSLNKKKKCIINRNGNLTYLVSKVEFSKDRFISLDEGYDIKENTKAWGSEEGYLEFYRSKTNKG